MVYMAIKGLKKTRSLRERLEMEEQGSKSALDRMGAEPGDPTIFFEKTNDGVNILVAPPVFLRAG